MQRNESENARSKNLKYLQYIVLVLIVVAMVAGRVLVGGWHEDGIARERLAKGDVTEAITAYDRSLHWYLPGSPTVTRAISGLTRIAQSEESRGDAENALRAWRVLRSGLYGSEWLLTPRTDIIAACDREIARLVSLKVPEPDRPAAYDKEMNILKKPSGPRLGWSILALAGFFSWTVGVVWFIFKAFGPKDEFYRKPAILIGLFIIAAYALWMIALSRA